MELYNAVMDVVIDWLWALPTFVILLGLGLLFSIWTKFIQYRALTHGVSVLRGRYDDPDDPGAINHFQALSAALSGTVGLGNIGGVALAIALGGPGSLFWMWMTGFFGMAIKTVEVTLSLMFRDTSDPDDPHGGAMWVITRGWGDPVGGLARPVARLVGGAFSVTLLIATFTGGNMFQAWNTANITNEYFGVPPVLVGVILAALTATVILGGIKRIGDVAGWLVPLMCGIYLVACLGVLAIEAAQIPQLLWLIVSEAFSPSKAQGAFLGASAWFGLTIGLRRALFSNEAGQGTSPIAHAAAKTDEPVREGIVAGLEPFIDTCLVCTLTALVILSTGAWNRGPVGDFDGTVRFVQEEGGHWKVDAETDLDRLPELPPYDSWEPGNGFFLLAEVPETNDQTLSTVIRIKGEIAEVQEDGRTERRIRWVNDSETLAKLGRAELVSQGVYRDFLGAALTGHAFDRAVPHLGKWMVTIACWLFAFSTLITWSYYGEQGAIFLFGKGWSVPTYKVIYCMLTVLATVPWFVRGEHQLENLSDLGTGLMLVTNVPIILLLSPLAIRAIRDYFHRLDSGTMDPPHKAPPILDVIEGKDVE